MVDYYPDRRYEKHSWHRYTSHNHSSADKEPHVAAALGLAGYGCFSDLMIEAGRCRGKRNHMELSPSPSSATTTICYDDVNVAALSAKQAFRKSDSGSAPTHHRPRHTRETGHMDSAETVRLIAEYHRTGDRRLRNQVLEAHLYVADRIVPRYSASPRSSAAGAVSAEDLRQTARVALLGAIERFDPNAGASLTTFATRTIEGELKRFLRDRTWLVRPPRRLQENHLNIRRATEELQHELGRIPTTGELAERVGVTEVDVRSGIIASHARVNESLDREVRSEGDSIPSSLAALIGSIDRNFSLCDDLNCLRAALKLLNTRELDFLRMRYYEQMSQSAIAAAAGVSQSYVSRVLQHAVQTLRSYFQTAT